MNIEVRPVSTPSDYRQFIYLPEKIHRDHANWVHPIYLDDLDYFNEKKNKSFSYCDTVLFLAFRNGEAVGRIMGIIHHPYNAQNGEKHARFSWMECYEDPEVYAALMGAVESWAGNGG